MAFPPASESQFQAWEKAIDAGVAADVAAYDAGTTLTALGRSDKTRKAEGLALSKERRAAKILRQLDARAPESDAVLLAQAKAEVPGYSDKTRLEISGTIEHEHHGRFSVANLVAIARERGIIDDRPVRELPGPAEVLPGPAE